MRRPGKMRNVYRFLQAIGNKGFKGEKKKKPQQHHFHLIIFPSWWNRRQVLFPENMISAEETIDVVEIVMRWGGHPRPLHYGQTTDKRETRCNFFSKQQNFSLWSNTNREGNLVWLALQYTRPFAASSIFTNVFMGIRIITFRLHKIDRGWGEGTQWTTRLVPECRRHHHHHHL